MNRRRLAAIALIIVVASGALWLLYPSIFPPDTDDNGGGTGGTNINYSSLNNLNWWDIAWDSIDIGDLLTPFSMVASFPNRYGPSSDYYAAGDYLIEQLEGMGLTAAYFGNHESIVAYQPGYGNDSRAIVFGANLDTRESIGPQINSNSIGCGVVTTIAEAVSQFRLPIDIYYCFYQGSWVILDALTGLRAMWGSVEIVDYFDSQGIDVIANYNFADLLFYDSNQDESDRIHVDYKIDEGLNYQRSKYLGDIFVSFMKKSGLNIATSVYEAYTQSDHWKYWAAGIPAVHVHQGQVPDPEFPPQDALGSADYNYTQALIAAKAGAATAVYLAMQGNGEPTHQKMYVTLQPNEFDYLRAVLSISQTLTINGTVSKNESILVRITHSSSPVIPLTLIEDDNFSLTAENATGIGEIAIYARNSGNETVKLELDLFYNSDTDGNGILDSQQYHWPDPDPPLDWDHDGLSDMDELAYDTDMFHPDTDRDGMSDNNEVLYGLEPLRRDAREDKDADGLLNQREIRIGTHPGLNDTDMDSMLDEWEVVFQTNPLLNDSALDLDGDNLTNIQEYLYGSDPRSVDGDYDGVPDFMEYQLGMNALNDDTDQDGLRDLLELQEGLDPLVPDNDIDLEPDGPDHNPKINTIIMLILFTLIPVGLGTLYFWRRLH